MEPEGSLPYTQEPATCPYPEPDESSLRPPPNLSKIHFNIILPSTPGDVSRYRNILRKRAGSTRSRCLEKSLWKRLWTCRKITECMNEWTNER
jgi:hypothetical protein